MAYDVNASTWTAAELLSSVREKAQLPASSTTYTDARILREASEVLWSFAGWAMQMANDGRLSESFARSASAALSSPYRAASEFELPPLAIGDTVQSVCWLNATGDAETRLARIDVSEQSTVDSPDSTGAPMYYALLAGRIRVYPQPSEGGVIRFQYQMRHPALIADSTSTVATVTSVADATTNGTLFNLSAATPLAIGDLVDVISNQGPYRHLFTSLYCTASTGTTATLFVPYAYLSGMSVSGLRLVKSGQSPYVHYPLEFRSSVHALIASNLMRDIGDEAGMRTNEQWAKDDLMRVAQMLYPRTKNDRVYAVNPFSLMRTGARARRWRW